MIGRLLCSGKKCIRLLTTTLFLLAGLQGYALNPDTAKISLDLQEKPLKEAFQEIEKQTNLSFIYSNGDIDENQEVTVQLKNEGLIQALDKILFDKNISYKIVNNQIVLTPKSNTNAEKNQNPVKVTGRIADISGTPLPGVNILIKGTSMGTVTDLDGLFSIDVVPGNTIVVSFIGYDTEEFVIDQAVNLNITLEEELQALEEVVVIGYGEESRRLLISSIADVSASEIEKTASNGVLEAMQGKAAGVQITQNSGTPGAALTVNVRGVRSLSAGTQPLYVVDGIPIITGDKGQLNFEGQAIDALADINPNNIESISILKDASSAAIYGARGANGVVLITTKTGRKNKTSINLNAYTGIQQIAKKLPMLNAREWRDYVRTFDPTFVNSLADTTIDTDWQDEVLRVAPITNIDLSFTGGEDKTRFYISGRYFSQDGIVLGTAYEKYGGQFNIDHNISNNLLIGAKVGVNYSINDRVLGDQTINGVLPNAISKPPVYAVRDSLGNYLEEGFWENPVAIGNEVTNRGLGFRNISNFYLDWKIIEDLKYRHQWGVDYYNLYERRYEPTTVRQGAINNGIGIDARSENFKLTHLSTLAYSKSFADVHHVSFLLGYSFEQLKERSNYIEKRNFPSNELQYVGSASETVSASGGGEDEVLASVFARAKYNYQNKYLIEGTIRRDGSSRFGPNYRYAIFPSLSFGWRLSEEDFIKNIPSISELKFKLSAGQSGNDQIGRERYKNLYSSNRNYYGQPGLAPTQIPNEDLKWETTTTFNTGLDIGVLNDRIYLVSDIYYMKTTDLLLFRPLNSSSGFTGVWDNIGAMENKGFDLNLTTQNIQGTFSWDMIISYSMNKNKILTLYNGQPITGEGRGENAAFEGYPASVFYMYESQGVDPSTGELVFTDANPNGIVDGEDRLIVGDPNPVFTAGVTNDLRYKGFDLSFFIQIVYGNDIYNGTRQYAEAMTFGTSDNQLVTIKDRWMKPGDRTYIPRHNGLYNNTVSSHYIEDGSFLRLKELTLGYNFPEKLLRGTKYIKSARVYLKGQNLFTLTPYSGMDPDVNYTGFGDLRRGTDFFTYPQPRSYIAGVKLNF